MPTPLVEPIATEQPPEGYGADSVGLTEQLRITALEQEVADLKAAKEIIWNGPSGNQ